MLEPHCGFSLLDFRVRNHEVSGPSSAHKYTHTYTHTHICMCSQYFLGSFLAPLLAQTVSISMASGCFASYLVLQPGRPLQGDRFADGQAGGDGKHPIYSVLTAV